jgi:hypothetical protein
MPAGTLQRLSDYKPAEHKENINRRAAMRHGLLYPLWQLRERRHVAQQHVKREQAADAIQRVEALHGGQHASKRLTRYEALHSRAHRATS